MTMSAVHAQNTPCTPTIRISSVWPRGGLDGPESSLKRGGVDERHANDAY